MKDGKITLEDVANLARVSRTSVSSVLNNAAPVRMSAATRQKILDAAQKLNYRRNIVDHFFIFQKNSLNLKTANFSNPSR